MAHDLENPRTRNYSKFKSIAISLEIFLKKSFLFFFVFVNFFFHTQKKKYIDIGTYKDKDNRFINYLLLSLKKKYNFSYNISFSITDFIKKIGIKNFIFNSTPNFLVKDIDKIKFLLNAKNNNYNELNFNTNYFTNDNKNQLFLPYYMYPKLYNKDYFNLDKLEGNKKVVKIFFSGSTNKEIYQKFVWYDNDGKKLLNRVEIINFVIKNFKEKIFFLNSFRDFAKINFFKTPIVLSVNDGLIKKTKTNLTRNQHFEIISKSKFLLTAPGADMPLCHHLIEGIKLKTIPISNYANLHQPSISKDDYLYFTDYDSLKEMIIKALNMDDYTIELKQKNLNIFYKSKLSPDSFLKSFENRHNNEIKACNDVESLRWL